MSSQVVAQLPRDARRVIVRGTSGSGKTTLARRIAGSIGVAHIELDAVFHQPGWTSLDDEEFRSRVRSFAAEPGWVACGNYGQVAPILLERADTLVLFDLPRPTVMSRVIRRTLRRAIRREELWNGNRERLGSMLSRDPETSIIAWSWTTHGDRHAEMRGLLADPPRGDLRLVHVASRDDERLVYAGLSRSTVPQ